MKTEMKAMKFRVKDAAHSEEIQRALFARGYGWVRIEKSSQFTDKPFLYTESNGNLMFSGADEDFFNGDPSPEFVLADGSFIEAKATKVVEHDGVKYEVPSWVKYLTRDNDRAGVFGWERKPVWTETVGYFHDDSDKGRVRRAEVYIAPKPDGNFFAEV